VANAGIARRESNSSLKRLHGIRKTFGSERTPSFIERLTSASVERRLYGWRHGGASTVALHGSACGTPSSVADPVTVRDDLTPVPFHVNARSFRGWHIFVQR
jgi:hypothetical protein